MAELTELGGADGRDIALSALEETARRQPEASRLSDAALRRVVDIAWRWQFVPVDRAKARQELKEALKPEIDRRTAEKSMGAES
jgi:hypothetical protein